MKNYKLSALKKQAGMTLIELTVVLMILIGLAGLLIPYVAGFVGRTHDSSGADSLQEVAKAIAGYDAKYGGYPGGFDRLVDSNGVATSYLMNAGVAAATDMNVTNIQSLFRGGITTLKGMCDDAADADPDCANFNPTFSYNDSLEDWDLDVPTMMTATINGAAPAAGDALMVVSAADANTVCSIENAAEDLDGDTVQDNIYVMLGVGPNSDMTGRTIQSAPVHFAQVGAMNANNRYNRFVGIFKVDNDPDVNGNGSPATLACTAMAMMSLEGPQEALQRYYDRQEQEG